MTSKLAVRISFSSPFINGNTKYIEMKFEAFESQKAIVLEIVKKCENVIFDHIVGKLVSRLIFCLQLLSKTLTLQSI